MTWGDFWPVIAVVVAASVVEEAVVLKAAADSAGDLGAVLVARPCSYTQSGKPTQTEHV